MNESFVFQAMRLEGASVSVEEDDEIVVTYQEHDGHSTIEAEPVHDLLEEHGLTVTNTIADFDAGELQLVIDASATGGV